MRKDRLLKLADFLETVPRVAFNIERWVTSGATKPEGARPGDCGFAGCAIGWAAHANLFEGLSLLEHSPSYHNTEGFEAVDLLFDFDDADPEDYGAYLFHFANYPAPHNPTPEDVAARIRQFVKTDGAI